MLKARVLSPLDDRRALQAIFCATLKAFREIAATPGDVRLTMAHYRRLRGLNLTQLEAAYLIASASGVTVNPDIEERLHKHVAALKDFAACPVQPDPKIVRHWTRMLDRHGRQAVQITREAVRRLAAASGRPAASSAVVTSRSARLSVHSLRHTAVTHLVRPLRRGKTITQSPGGSRDDADK